jgi:hypothetical protein
LIILESSSVGMLEYIFSVSKDTNLRSGLRGISVKSFMRCTEFFTLKVLGSGICD